MAGAVAVVLSVNPRPAEPTGAELIDRGWSRVDTRSRTSASDLFIFDTIRLVLQLGNCNLDHSNSACFSLYRKPVGTAPREGGSLWPRHEAATGDAARSIRDRCTAAAGPRLTPRPLRHLPGTHHGQASACPTRGA